jgi:hypothetical protein
MQRNFSSRICFSNKHYQLIVGMAAMKRRLLIILIAAIMVFALGLAGWWWNDRLGDLSLGNRGIARRYGTVSFDPIRWQAADQAERGRMVADLMRKHRFLGLKNKSVFDLLGPSTCYLGSEDEPCYDIEFEGKSFQLGFGVNHSDKPGEVVYVSIRDC